MNSKVGILATAKSYIGMHGRPNPATQWYAKRHGKGYLTAAWCDMFISYIAYISGLSKEVGEYAWCPSHVSWFKKNKRWYKTPQVGDMAFFDWNKDGAADHVGIVESVKGNTVFTIEGNKGDAVRRVARTTGILGYGRPLWPSDRVPKVYVVQKGDSLTGIAFHYYADYSRWRDIYRLNKKTIGKDPGLIKPGMKLTLPAS